MAAATLPVLIDPTKSGKFPVTIGEDLLEQPRKRQRFSVQYNHKPATIKGRTATIKPSTSGQKDNSFDLSIQSDEEAGKYIYHGSQKPLESLALVYNSTKQSFALERLNAEFRFNLRSTPSNKDISSLASQYSQLETGHPSEAADGLSAGGESDQEPDELPPDPNNPFDYRHFLHQEADPSPQTSRISSPMPSHTFASSPLLKASSPIQRPRSVTEPKKTSRPRQRYLSPHPREDADADNEDSDSNELVIDMGDSAPRSNKHWRSALGVLNEGGRGSGPISFRSAASSMSPSIRGVSDDEEDAKRNQDVEEIDLGEPASNNVEPKEASTNDNGWDEEDDDLLEAELEQALEEQQEAEQGQDEVQDVPQPHIAAESSSESEEE